MSDILFYTKHEFVSLMRRKRGTEFTLGWLAMAWTLPLSKEDEQALMQRETEIMLQMPDQCENSMSDQLH
jgi:hypothetical protein